MADIYKGSTDKLITDLKTISGILNVEEYAGQFNKNSPYQNNPPEILVEFNGIEAFDPYGADGKIMQYKMHFILYCVLVDPAAVHSLVMLQRIVDFADGRTIAPVGVPAMRLKAGDVKLAGYLEGGAKLYEFNCELF